MQKTHLIHPTTPLLTKLRSNRVLVNGIVITRRCDVAIQIQQRDVLVNEQRKAHATKQ